MAGMFVMTGEACIVAETSGVDEVGVRGDGVVQLIGLRFVVAHYTNCNRVDEPGENAGVGLLTMNERVNRCRFEIATRSHLGWLQHPEVPEMVMSEEHFIADPRALANKGTLP